VGVKLGAGARAVGFRILALVTKRVLLVEHSETGHVGGSLTGLLHLVRGLDRARYDATLLLYEPKELNGALDGTGCRVVVVPGVAGKNGGAPTRTPDTRAGRAAEMRRAVGAVRRFVQKDLPRARALLPILRAERPHLVHLGNGIKPNLDGVIAARWAGVPCIAHEKGLVKYTPFDRLWARAVDTTVCMTDAVREHLIAQGVRGTRLEVVHDGIDLGSFRPGRDRSEMRTALGLAPENLAVGMAVNVQPWKGQDVTLKAVAALAPEFPALRCVLAGGIVRGAEWFHERIQEYVAAERLGDRVRFLGSRSDVPDVLNALDVVIHASVTPEPFGRILIEAMALGKPLVASAAGGVLEIVEDGRSGVLVPPGDAVALAAALRRLLADSALRDALGAAGRRRAYDHFSVEHFANAMQGVYDQVLGG
jgi:glycosyltransferase involved in cell wall biosynthesis